MNGGFRRTRPADRTDEIGTATGGAAAAAALALVLTLIMAAPVLTSPSTRLFGREIAGRHHDPFTVISQFENPRGLGLLTQPATDWLGAAAARLLGNGVWAYHVVILATFPLAAYFAFLLARRLTGSSAAAWPASLVYAFLPFHWAHAAYHPHVAQTQWLPLYLLALWLCAEGLSPRRAILLVVATILVCLSNFYLGLVAALLTPVALGAQWALAVRAGSPRPHRAPLGTAALLLALALGGLAYVARWAPAVLGRRSALAFPAADVERYTARWWAYLVPPVDHPLGGARLAGFWARQDAGGLVELQLTLGLAVVALAAVAGVAWWRGDRPRLTRSVPWLAAVGATALAFSLPPVWRLGPLALPAPSGLLHALAPMFRAHARFGLAVGLAAAILAGIGLRWLWLRPGRGRAAACGLTLLLLVELAPFPPWRWRDVLPTSAHRWLASSAETIRLLDCVDQSDPTQIGVDRFFPHPMTRLPPAVDCGDPQTPGRLASASYSHLLVRRNGAYGRWLAGRPSPPGLEPVGEFDDAFLFAVTAPGAPRMAVFGQGFHRREFKDGASYRWMTGSGRLDLLVRVPIAAPAALDLELHAFPAPRDLEARLDSKLIAQLRVGVEPATHRVELGNLGLGHHRLELVSLSPPVVADEVLANGDRRALTVALWDWDWIVAPPDR